MNEQDLRALVRDAVARHMGGAHAEAPNESLPARTAVPHQPHPSHSLYLTLVNTTDACIIEPSVPCEHCEYCKSHGH
jgi:hypothetical protein